MTEKKGTGEKDWLCMREGVLNYGVKLRRCLQMLKIFFLVVRNGVGGLFRRIKEDATKCMCMCVIEAGNRKRKIF